MGHQAAALLALILLSGVVSGGSDFKIGSVAELKEAIHSPGALEIVKSPEAWLPELVAALQWNTDLSEHFVLHYHIDVSDEHDHLFDSLLADMETIYRELEEFFRIRPESKQERLALKTRLICFFVKTRSERTFGTLPDPHLLFYLMDSEEDPDYKVKLRHELAHWLWGRVYGEAPPLFNEGMAVYAEKMSAPDSVEWEFFAGSSFDIPELPPLKEIMAGDEIWKLKGMYTLSGLWIHFLIEEWGWEKLKEFFLSSDFEDPRSVEHFEEVYGEKIKSVEAAWRACLARKGIL